MKDPGCGNFFPPIRDLVWIDGIVVIQEGVECRYSMVFVHKKSEYSASKAVNKWHIEHKSYI